MIDASNITEYNLNDNDLESRLIFWVLAAGKNGTRAASIVNMILEERVSEEGSIFKFFREYTLEELKDLCYVYSTGCHNNKGRTIYETINSKLDLKTCTSEDLEKIFGIGMKTARCFIIHSRKDCKYAGLDTHMLKHLRSLGHAVPKSTPTNKNKYLTIEKIVLNLANLAGKTPANYDLEVWNKYKQEI